MTNMSRYNHRDDFVAWFFQVTADGDRSNDERALARLARDFYRGIWTAKAVNQILTELRNRRAKVWFAQQAARDEQVARLVFAWIGDWPAPEAPTTSRQAAFVEMAATALARQEHILDIQALNRMRLVCYN